MKKILYILIGQKYTRFVDIVVSAEFFQLRHTADIMKISWNNSIELLPPINFSSIDHIYSIKGINIFA